MPLIALSLVLTSALLHAGWNAIVKAGDDRLVAGWGTTAAGAILALGVLGVAGAPILQGVRIRTAERGPACRLCRGADPCI